MPLLKIHKDKHHVSNPNPTTAAVCYKCDEVESKASFVKKQTRNSSTQNTPFDEPIFRFTDDKSTLEVNNEVKREVLEATDCQEFLRDEKPILLKGSEYAPGHGRSSRDANRTGSITDFNWKQ